MPSLIRLSPHPFSSLPAHPSLHLTTSPPPPRPPILDFLRTALTEAQSLLTNTIPETFALGRKLHPSPPSTAKVQLSKRTIHADPGGKTREVWACRRSIHEDAAVHGTASFGEFRRGLRENHAENERAYTPSVTGAERLLEWPRESEVEGWREVDMHVNVITHTFHPTLLRPRTFITLLISADLANPVSEGFVAVQIPLAADPTESIPADLRGRIASSAPRNAVFASYASVEQVLALPFAVRSEELTSRVGAGASQVEWTMATTSDAGGAIPRWVQRSWTMGGVPKAITADVGLFIKWMGQSRVNNRKANTEERGQ